MNKPGVRPPLLPGEGGGARGGGGGWRQKLIFQLGDADASPREDTPVGTGNTSGTRTCGFQRRDVFSDELARIALEEADGAAAHEQHHLHVELEAAARPCQPVTLGAVEGSFLCLQVTFASGCGAPASAGHFGVNRWLFSVYEGYV